MINITIITVDRRVIDVFIDYFLKIVYNTQSEIYV